MPGCASVFFSYAWRSASEELWLMPQELTSHERAEFAQLLQDTFAEQQVKTLLTAFERLTLRSDPTRIEQALQNLQVQVVDGQQSLQGALEKLAESQVRTDESLQKLADAQARTEGRVENLEAAMERMAAAQARTDESLQKLADAQARTEGRVGNLEAAIERMAIAQTQTDESLKVLSQEQARTEGRVGNLEATTERLVAAQMRTDESLQKLSAVQTRTDESLKALSQEQAQTGRVVRDLARQVDGLSNRLGGDLEDVAYIVLHDVLGRELGWQVGELKRDWQKWNGEAIELDIFGQAQDPKQPGLPIWIVGEAK